MTDVVNALDRFYGAYGLASVGAAALGVPANEDHDNVYAAVMAEHHQQNQSPCVEPGAT